MDTMTINYGWRDKETGNEILPDARLATGLVEIDGVIAVAIGIEVDTETLESTFKDIFEDNKDRYGPSYSAWIIFYLLVYLQLLKTSQKAAGHQREESE